MGWAWIVDQFALQDVPMVQQFPNKKLLLEFGLCNLEFGLHSAIQNLL
jgi:hypothetical protein